MYEEEFHTRMDRMWSDLDQQGRDLRDPLLVLERFRKWFAGLEERDQQVASEGIVMWVTDQNPAKRYDAMALIQDFSIVDAIPQLLAFAEVMDEAQRAPERDEAQKSREIAAHLATLQG